MEVNKEPDWFKPGIEFALKALSEPKNKVYCHCAGGVNRGPSMTYSILRALGLDEHAARNLIKNARPCVGLRYKADADVAVKILGYT